MEQGHNVKNAQEVVANDLQYILENLAEEFQNLRGSRMLITGGAGFLGYYLVQAVEAWNRQADVKQRCRLEVWDNFMRGVPQWLTELEGKSATLSVKKFDVNDPLPDAMGDFDYIIHAATIASPIYYRLHPIQTMDANVLGLRNFLEYARLKKDQKKPLKGFLFYSTSEIYGDPTADNIPTPETYRGNVSCTGPRACYDESKRYGETLCVNFARQYGLPIRIARPFNNYGPGLKITDRRALPDFARDIFAGRDVVLLSDGAPTRTFCYVADAVVGYYKILFRGRDGESYNIGIDTPEISIRELALRTVDCAKALLGYEGKAIFGESSDADYLTDNPNRRCPIIDKARGELDYNPGVQLEEGIKRSLIWYRDNNQAEDA